MEEMFPRAVPEAQPVKQFAFIEKAKLTITGEKKVEPFNFTPSVSSIIEERMTQVFETATSPASN